MIYKYSWRNVRKTSYDYTDLHRIRAINQTIITLYLKTAQNVLIMKPVDKLGALIRGYI